MTPKLTEMTGKIDKCEYLKAFDRRQHSKTIRDLFDIYLIYFGLEEQKTHGEY